MLGFKKNSDIYENNNSDTRIFNGSAKTDII